MKQYRNWNNMKPEEITALAREYVEEMKNITDGNNPYIATKEVAVKIILNFLLRRYVLVEKEKLKRVIATQLQECERHSEGSKAWCYHVGSARTLKYLFPEIVKEVEA